MSTHAKGSKPGQHSKALLSSLCQVSACGRGCRGETLATPDVPPSRLPLRACGCTAVPAGPCPDAGWNMSSVSHVSRGLMGSLSLFLASDFKGSVKGFHFSVSYLFRMWSIIVPGVGGHWSTRKNHALLSERWDCVSGSFAETRAGEAEACGVRGDCRQAGLWPGASPTLRQAA